MPDASARLDAWRAEFQASGWVSPAQLDELEDHLCATIDELVGSGMDEPAAFELAVLRLGRATCVAREYTKGKLAMTGTTKLIGTLILVLFLGLATGLGGELGAFVNLPALVLLLGIVAGGLWAGFGPRATWSALSTSLVGGESDPERLARAAAVCGRGYQLSWAGGVLLTMMGIILCLARLDDPSRIGMGLSLSLLSLLYGAALAELGFRTLRQWVVDPR